MTNLMQPYSCLLYTSGVLYDSLGLWGLARYDFTQALALQPKMASVYNYLGLYLLPVSYTHLDVYKRQEVTSLRLNALGEPLILPI